MRAEGAVGDIGRRLAKGGFGRILSLASYTYQQGSCILNSADETYHGLVS